MSKLALLISFAVLGLAANPASAANEANAASPAAIPFANSGGVWDWTTGEDDRSVYFQDRHRQWCRRPFMQAFDLPFTTAIRIDSGATNTLDKWRAIYVGRQRYSVRSFE